MILLTSFKNLFRNLRRTLTVVLTIAFGVSSIFIFNGFNTGVMNQYRDGTIKSRFGNGQINLNDYRSKVWEKPWEMWMQNFPEIETKLKGVDGVINLFPRVEFFGLLTNGKITVSGKGQGIDGVKEADFFTGLNVIEGTPLKGEADGIILGIGLARALDVKPGDKITVLGNTVFGSMNALDATVTGIFHTGMQNFDDTFFRVQIKAAQTLLDTDRVESVVIGLKDVSYWKPFAAEVAKNFKTVEATPFEVLDKVYYQNSIDWLESQFRIILMIILAIVVLGIFNSISSTIFERKQEIGNLRANGESGIDVLKLLTSEGLLQGLIGSVLGIIFSLIVVYVFFKNGLKMPPGPGITRQFFVPIELQPKMALFALSLGLSCSLIGTWFAGFRILRLKIAEALRSV